MRAFLVVLTALSWPGLSLAASFELQPGQQVLDPFTHGKLAVYPVAMAAGVARDDTKYLTLKEGLKEKLVSVREMGQGGDVNQVRVKNNSDRPLLLLAGELLLGGQQDRVTSVDTILEPRSSRVVGVFCVEHGRWAGQSQFAGQGGLAEGKLRRIARWDKSQQGVWNHVAGKTAALKGQSSTGTYRTLATGQAGEEVMKPYRAAIGDKLKSHPSAEQMVGVMIAVNGNLLSLEVFATPALFREYRDQVLDAAYLDAAGLDLKPALSAPTAENVKAWVRENEAAPPKPVDATPLSDTVSQDGVGSLGTSVNSKSGKAVYKSIQSKKY